MTKNTRKLATAAGAKTEADLTLFAALVSQHEQVQTLVAQTEDWRGMLLSCEFLRQRGRFYRPQPLPRGYRRRKVNECYDNSYKLAFFGDGLAYCEGSVPLSLSEDRVADLEHAWCVTAEGDVIDVTLRQPALSYFGVPFTREEMAAAESVPISDEIVAARLKQH